MIIKKFQANTETEAIMLAKDDLGKDAIVMNIKTIRPRGIFKFFKNSTVEITAAVDEYRNKATEVQKEPMTNSIYENSRSESKQNSFEQELEYQKGSNQVTEDLPSSSIEMKLNNLQAMLEKQISESAKKDVEEKQSNKEETENKKLPWIQLIYNQLLANEVDEKIINDIIGEIEPSLKKDATIDSILASIYQKIILKLGQTQTISITEGKTKYIFFIGPTGVGKTTTIAKIASSIKVEKKGKIALITSDTYRIAAVEQLRTYANILDVPLRVIYSYNEMEEVREDFKDYDIVLVDTAGRSHRSREQRDDIEKLINSIPKEDREIYLVLSATTKNKDLVRITDAYSEITDYRLIFTKLDETTSIGNIFNIKMLTGAPLSYVTYGQNVPDDISKIDAQQIAKQLLGGNE